MFLRVAQVVAQRGTCLRAMVGAVIVREGRIISIGYNGAPPRQPHCLEAGCLIPFKGSGCVRAVHAELNAILWAAREGIPTDRAVMYSTHSPCPTCAVTMVTAGICAVYYLHDYHASDLEILDNAGIYHEKVEHGARRPMYAKSGESVPGGADHSGDSDGGRS
jgi:dCMP deaminase